MSGADTQGTPGDGGGNSPPGRASLDSAPPPVDPWGTLPTCALARPELFGQDALDLAPTARPLVHPGLWLRPFPGDDPDNRSPETLAPGLPVELGWNAPALGIDAVGVLESLGRTPIRELPGGRRAAIVDGEAFLGLGAENGAPELRLLQASLAASLAPIPGPSHATYPGPPPGGCLMGIINLTPDSFSDGGRFEDPEEGLRHALDLEAEGAAILDLGGESTRPGSKSVGLEEERRRVLPTLRALVDRCRVPVSVDTTQGALAAEALAEGATLINDTSAGRGPGDLLLRVAEGQGGLVLMHMRGEPRTMQSAPTYTDPVSEVLEFLRSRVAAALEAGNPLERIWIDPGIGFGKTLEHNLAILRRLDEFRCLGLPVLLGTSRKSFLDHLARTFGAGDASADAGDRVGGTAATVLQGALAGVAVHRVHDVRRCAEALRVARGILHGTAVDPRPPKP